MELIAIIEDQKPDAVPGGTFRNGEWKQRTLNKLDYNAGGVALASNRFTLSQTGKYLIQWGAPAHNVEINQSKLVRVSPSPGDVKPGSTMNAGGDHPNFRTTSTSLGAAVVDIAAPTTYEIQHRCETTQKDVGFGKAAHGGINEVFTWVHVYKL